MKKAFVIFTGYNQRGVIAFIRVLVQHRVDYFLIAAGSRDSIFMTQYASKVVFTRENLILSEEDLVPALSAVADLASGKELILAPSTEALNRFFLAHQQFLKKFGIMVPLVEECLYKTISDKKSFCDLCLSHKIRVPLPLSDPGTCSLPFVAKPVAYDLARCLSPILVFSEQDREVLLKSPYLGNYYFQEFISGRSFYLLLYLSRNGYVNRFSQENLVQQPQGKSIIAATVSKFHLSQESERYISMLKAVGFFGLVMIEVRQQGEDYFMIEANPRFWGPSQLFVDAMTFNLFEAFLMDNNFSIHTRPGSDKGQLYFWYQGLLETLEAGFKPVFYNYTPRKLALNLPEWIRSDIYRRQDTIDIFSKQALGGF